MIAWWQILLLTLYAGFQIMDELHWYSSAGSAVFSGFITGLVMGDMATGLFIGGSMQLTILGVGTFGGASRIDANSGTLIATAFAVSAGMDPEQALAALGVPVAAILVYTDILGRMANTFWGHACDADIEKMNWNAYNVHYLMGATPTTSTTSWAPFPGCSAAWSPCSWLWHSVSRWSRPSPPPSMAILLGSALALRLPVACSPQWASPSCSVTCPLRSTLPT